MKEFIVYTEYGNLKTVAISEKKAVANVRYRLRLKGLFMKNYQVKEMGYANKGA